MSPAVYDNESLNYVSSAPLAVSHTITSSSNFGEIALTQIAAPTLLVSSNNIKIDNSK